MDNAPLHELERAASDLAAGPHPGQPNPAPDEPEGPDRGDDEDEPPDDAGDVERAVPGRG